MEKMSQNLEGLCDEWNLDFKQSFFIHLIVEELLLNIMKFGIGETDKKYYVSVKAVSYTHLDVYKRQEVIMAWHLPRRAVMHVHSVI